MESRLEKSAHPVDSHAVVLGELVELWSLVDAASRTYALRARVVPAPTRLLLWSLSHRRARHAARLMGVLSRTHPGSLFGQPDATAYIRHFRAEPPVDDADLGPVEALQRTLLIEGLIADHCSRLIASTAHTAIEHALRWQLADTRFAQHQIEVLLGFVNITPPRRPNG